MELTDLLLELWLSLVLFITMFVRALTGKGRGRSGCGRLASGKMYKHLFRFAFLERGWEIMHVTFFFAIVHEVFEFREVF